MKSFAARTYQFVRDALLARREIALLDVREADPHAHRHPLFAANLPLSKLELDALDQHCLEPVSWKRRFHCADGLHERRAMVGGHGQAIVPQTQPARTHASAVSRA